MAFGSRNKCKQIVSNIEFEEKLNPQSYGKIIIEILKYAIYTRGQIPLNYDLWHRDLMAQQNVDIKSVIKLNARRKNGETASNIGKWIQELIDLFINCIEIQQILFSIGATYVSPQILYNIKLPANIFVENGDCNLVSIQKHLIKVLQELLRTEDIASFKEIAPTNMFLFVKMKTNTRKNSFLPKPDFQPILRGTCVDINFKENLTLSKQLLTPFKVHDDSLTQSTVSGLKVTDEVDKLNVNGMTSLDSIWYQSSITVKGIKI